MYVKKRPYNSKLDRTKIKNVSKNGVGEEKDRKMSSDFLCTLDNLDG